MFPLIKQAVEAEKKLDENFEANGKTYLVRCPKCKRENYAMSVSSGVCAWCGYDSISFSDDKDFMVQFDVESLKKLLDRYEEEK